jgi:hypothetical protein
MRSTKLDSVVGRSKQLIARLGQRRLAVNWRHTRHSGEVSASLSQVTGERQHHEASDYSHEDEQERLRGSKSRLSL